ncbi:MAG: hypothetical protein A3B81_06280 [Candidatus Muproteobacteria bacterium RIFCSPHIGHO2_02_FULL_65_16]|uniref:Toxin CptA n=1 Tax=Candidatus Muproteobacteria bacterium RIFCSPHIGHO2_02_FULL_65_16 TaxID=1817766 RepID=A0A1F6TT05_9PROT|nr:MAG: hypothetical protein A3B81_06280 [Candidatus Muproteobacteria bacterium RIFCSPHIGHO2_02_FULL_65_16]
MSQRFDNNLILNIKVSRILIAVLAVAHLGGMVLVGIVPLAWGMRATLWAMLGLSLYRSVRRHGLRRGPGAIREFELDPDGICSVRLAGSEAWRECRCTSVFIHPRCVLATAALADRRWPLALVIVADAVEADFFRRLRARLRQPAAAA